MFIFLILLADLSRADPICILFFNITSFFGQRFSLPIFPFPIPLTFEERTFDMEDGGQHQ